MVMVRADAAKLTCEEDEAWPLPRDLHLKLLLLARCPQPPAVPAAHSTTRRPLRVGLAHPSAAARRVVEGKGARPKGLVLPRRYGEVLAWS